MTTTIDTIKAIFTYATCTFVVVGGMAAIYIARADPASADTVAIMAGFVGFALNFLFGAEVQTRTARQAAAAMAAATNGHGTPPAQGL